MRGLSRLSSRTVSLEAGTYAARWHSVGNRETEDAGEVKAEDRGGQPGLPADRLDDAPARRDGPGGIQAVGSDPQAQGAEARRAMSGVNREVDDPTRCR